MVERDADANGAAAISMPWPPREHVQLRLYYALSRALFWFVYRVLGLRRSVIVDYRRGAGGAEQVRVFVLLHGRHLYRLVCVAPSGQIARYEPTFQTVCGSFAPSDAGPTP